jgi:RNA polymerase sigma-70 factor (ECF subfamily)
MHHANDATVMAWNEGPVTAEALIALLPGLRAYAISKLRTRNGAEDVVQDTVERAWRNRHCFKEGENVMSWLRQIMRNLIIDKFRKDRRTVEDIDGLEAAKLVSLPEQLVRLECKDMIRRLDVLPPKCRQALVLIGTGATHGEAAAILGLPLSTLKSRVLRGRSQLAAMAWHVEPNGV